MIVVSDTSPICYLLLIGEIELLPQLYAQVLIPQTVHQELADDRSPAVVAALNIDDWRTEREKSSVKFSRVSIAHLLSASTGTQFRNFVRTIVVIVRLHWKATKSVIAASIL